MRGAGGASTLGRFHLCIFLLAGVSEIDRFPSLIWYMKSYYNIKMTINNIHTTDYISPASQLIMNRLNSPQLSVLVYWNRKKVGSRPVDHSLVADGKLDSPYMPRQTQPASRHPGPAPQYRSQSPRQIINDIRGSTHRIPWHFYLCSEVPRKLKFDKNPFLVLSGV